SSSFPRPHLLRSSPLPPTARCHPFPPRYLPPPEISRAASGLPQPRDCRSDVAHVEVGARLPEFDAVPMGHSQPRIRCCAAAVGFVPVVLAPDAARRAYRLQIGVGTRVGVLVAAKRAQGTAWCLWTARRGASGH
ncbi:unnamed protein product, partial [Urochloa humidicola]